MMVDSGEIAFRYPLLARLGPEWVDAWLRRGQEISVGLGEPLMEAGSRGRYAYIVLSGGVRVVRPGGEGREHSLGVFHPGEMLGEYALVPPHANTATCRAATESKLLRLPLSFIRQFLDHWPADGPTVKDWMRLHAIARYARGTTCLGFQSATSFVPWLEACEEMTFEPGESLQAVGLNADRWFVLTNGSARLTVGAKTRQLTSGDCFGESALLGEVDLPYVEAIEECACLALPRGVFDPEGAETSAVQSALPQRLPPQQAWIKQRATNDCGAAALVMAARQLRVEATLEAVDPLVAKTEAGTTLLELQQAAKQLGLLAQAVRVASTHLRHLRLPAVAHMRGAHYVTLFECRAGRVVLGDPACGVRTISLDAFLAEWSGQLLLLASSAAAEESRVHVPRPPRVGTQTWTEANTGR